MFERMKIVESIYEGGATYKKTQRLEAKHASYVRNKKGGASALPSNPEQGHADKRKSNNASRPEQNRHA